MKSVTFINWKYFSSCSCGLPARRPKNNFQGSTIFHSCFGLCVLNQLGASSFLFVCWGTLVVWKPCFFITSGQTGVVHFVLYLNQRNEDVGWDKDFVCLFLVLIKEMSNHIEFKISFSNPRGMKQAVKNRCVGGRGGGMLQVSGMW